MLIKMNRLLITAMYIVTGNLSFASIILLNWTPMDMRACIGLT